jgi:hypothetical protein
MTDTQNMIRLAWERAVLARAALDELIATLPDAAAQRDAASTAERYIERAIEAAQAAARALQAEIDRGAAPGKDVAGPVGPGVATWPFNPDRGA